MAVDAAFRIEVETIHALMDTFEYYQLLKVAQAASTKEIGAAFRRESRIFHPDRFFAANDEDLKSNVSDIYKRISEAYGVLKDVALRKIYDEQLAGGGPTRFDRAAYERSLRASASPSHVARTVKGRKFLELALRCAKRSDFNGATMNFQFSLSAEPGNEGIQALFDTFQEKSGGKRGGGSNAYKLRFA